MCSVEFRGGSGGGVPAMNNGKWHIDSSINLVDYYLRIPNQFKFILIGCTIFLRSDATAILFHCTFLYNYYSRVATILKLNV